jgi:nucleoside-triphosphatase THEP1
MNKYQLYEYQKYILKQKNLTPKEYEKAIKALTKTKNIRSNNMIKKPEEMDFRDKNIIMIISGLPGVGKTTLALSSPSVLLIDADEGMARVKPEHRKDSSICKKYEEILEDIKNAEGTYKTIVIDTAGALIELMKDWAIRNEPSASKKSGGFSQQGYGFVKTEFLRLSAELRRKFNVVLLFHTNKDKQDDTVFYDIICEGSAKNLVWQPADLGAYMFIQNGERYLGFTPTENYNAKSAYGIKGLIKIPELADGDENDFLTKLFDKVKQNIAQETNDLKPLKEAYEKTIANGIKLIDEISKPEDALPCLSQIRALPHALTSQKELEAAFKKRLKDLGYEYNKEAKAYVTKEQQ